MELIKISISALPCQSYLRHNSLCVCANNCGTGNKQFTPPSNGRCSLVVYGTSLRRYRSNYRKDWLRSMAGSRSRDMDPWDIAITHFNARVHNMPGFCLTRHVYRQSPRGNRFCYINEAAKVLPPVCRQHDNINRMMRKMHNRIDDISAVL